MLASIGQKTTAETEFAIRPRFDRGNTEFCFNSKALEFSTPEGSLPYRAPPIFHTT